MKEHGILFATAMVRAILAGTKTTTRRLVKAQSAEAADVWADNGDGTWSSGWRGDGGNLATLETVRAPHGPVGRRLWVRETWRARVSDYDPEGLVIEYAAGGTLPLHADDVPDDWQLPMGDKWKPSIHMPRWASRITLEVTRVRVERAQDISVEDIVAEGVTREAVRDLLPVHAFKSSDAWNEFNEATPRDLWRIGWREINGAGSWASNPWVWVYDFRRVG